MNGIVGILEGFGLLNEESQNPVSIEQINELIAQAFENAQNTAVKDDTVNVNLKVATNGNENGILELIARMPQDDQTNTLQMAQSEIENLVKEYLCSFANVNKKGADEESLRDQGSNTSLDLQEPVQDAAGNLKLQLMLKDAIEKLRLKLQGSEANTNETAQSGDTAQKVMDKLMLMVREVNSKNTNSKDMKVSTDNQEVKSNDASTSGIVTGAGAEPKTVQTVHEAEAQPLQEMSSAKTAQDNMERIIQKMTVSLKEGNQEFEVALKPEYLGKLSIKLTMDNDGIKAHIKAADSSVKGMIADQLPALQEALKDKGFTVTHIEVSYEKPAFDSRQPHHQNWQNNGNNQKSTRYAVSDFGGISYDMMSDVTELLNSYSSVEFQA